MPLTGEWTAQNSTRDRCHPQRCQVVSFDFPSQSLTWNLKMAPWNRRFLLETIIFRFHVKLGEGWTSGFDLFFGKKLFWSRCQIQKPQLGCQQQKGSMMLHSFLAWWVVSRAILVWVRERHSFGRHRQSTCCVSCHTAKRQRHDLHSAPHIKGLDTKHQQKLYTPEN